MKRLVSFLLLWALCTACSVAVVAESAEISLSFIEQSFEVEGNQIAQLYANFPSLDGMNDRQAMEVVNAAIRDYILRESGFDQACDYAREAYEIDPEAFTECDHMYWVLASGIWALRTETLLSVRYDFTLDAGGPHPWHTIAAQHYD